MIITINDKLNKCEWNAVNQLIYTIILEYYENISI
jgi:hypothetical protein